MQEVHLSSVTSLNHANCALSKGIFRGSATQPSITTQQATKKSRQARLVKKVSHAASSPTQALEYSPVGVRTVELRRGDDGGRSWVHREGADLVAELLARDLDDFKLAQACLQQMREIRDLHGRQVSQAMVRARETDRELQSQLY